MQFQILNNTRNLANLFPLSGVKKVTQAISSLISSKFLGAKNVSETLEHTKWYVSNDSPPLPPKQHNMVVILGQNSQFSEPLAEPQMNAWAAWTEQMNAWDESTGLPPPKPPRTDVQNQESTVTQEGTATDLPPTQMARTGKPGQRPAIPPRVRTPDQKGTATDLPPTPMVQTVPTGNTAAPAPRVVTEQRSPSSEHTSTVKAGISFFEGLAQPQPKT